MARNEENLSLDEVHRNRQQGLLGELGKDGEPDPVEIITDDHSHLQLLLNEYEGDEKTERFDMLQRILRVLDTHLRLEEEALYPAIAEQGREGRVAVDEARRMHERIRGLMRPLRKARRIDRKTDAAFGALEMLLEEHAEWEEAEIHPLTYDMGQGDLAGIGEAMLKVAGRFSSARRREM